MYDFINRIIATVKAEDPNDNPPNQIAEFAGVTYNMVGDGNARSFFEIDTATGVITLRSRVSVEVTEFYRVSFRAGEGE